jgi:hypothetical protein
MSVPFKQVRFLNLNALPVNVTIEAPIGIHAAGPTSIGAAMTSTIPLSVVDCVSCRITASYTANEASSQTFIVAPPVNGAPAFLDHVNVSYVIPAFTGCMTACTEGGPDGDDSNDD